MFSVDKSDFIEFSLQPFIQRLDDSVESLTYEYDDGTAEEYCIISYKNKHKRKVCITADKVDAYIANPPPVQLSLFDFIYEEV